MGTIYNSEDNVYWFDTTAEITADTLYVREKTAKAIAIDDMSKVYVSNGTIWVEMG